jgi:glycosyltransferase involved in cell wall biosynthesis
LSSENHETTAIHFEHYATIDMVTVIIPTLNEQTTISHVVKLVKEATAVTEILVIDDKSHDNTFASLVNFIQ